MKNYTNASPVFSDTIQIYETSDANNAESVLNVPLKKLQDNVLWLKENAGLKGFVKIPTLNSPTEYTYDGSEKEVTFSDLDTNKIDVTGATATDAGDYVCTLSLKNSAQYLWEDLSSAPKTFAWSIDKIPLTVPEVASNLTYNGTEQSPTIAQYDTSLISKSGDAETNAGNYNVTFSLVNPDNYEWNDGTSADKNAPWSIAKAPGSITLSKNSITLESGAISDTVSVSGLTGPVTLTSSDSAVATVSPASLTAEGGTTTISSPNEVTGSATITANVAATTNYEATSAVITVTATFVLIYGVQWDGSGSPSWSRTDDAADFIDPSPAVNNGGGSSPFDSIAPWSEMQKSTRTAGVMVSLPKYYYKWTKTGKVMKLQIVPGQFAAWAESNGYRISPTHLDRGDGVGARDTVYVGRYHCASDYKSTTGVKPLASKTRAQFRSGIHGLGSNIWQWDFPTVITLWMLYLVEYGNWNSQATLGYGCGNGSGTENMGSTDAMQYHTGTSAVNRTTYGHIQYRNIEDPWANVFDWYDGVYFSGADIYAILNPANFSDSSGGTKVGTRPTSSGYISEFGFSSVSGYEWFMYPSAVDGTDSTYICDYCYCNASGAVLRGGGDYNQDQSRGLFYLDGNDAASDSGANIGARLLELPAAA